MTGRMTGWALAGMVLGCGGAERPRDAPAIAAGPSGATLATAATSVTASVPVGSSADRAARCRLGSETGALPAAPALAPAPRRDPVRCAGSCFHPDTAMIRRLIRSRDTCYRACFEAGSRPSPSLGGRVVVRIVVEEGTGRVRSAEVQSHDGLTSEVAACVAAETLDLQLPPPVCGDLTIVYPLRFAPPS